MRAPVYGLKGSRLKYIEVPTVFNTPFRPDVIHRAFVALSSHSMQPQGRDPMAGERTTAESYGVGRGMARVARVKGERHPRSGQAAGVAGVVGGRVPHPPRAEKRLRKKVNRKERWLATASAIAATASKDLVIKRGHRVDKVRAFPLVVSKEIEGVSRVRDLQAALAKLGLDDDLARVRRSAKRHSGTRRRRGRVSGVSRGPLIVVSEDQGLSKATQSLPGVECVEARDLSVLHLAPGSNPGRLTLWSEAAFNHFAEPVMKVVERFEA